MSSSISHSDVMRFDIQGLRGLAVLCVVVYHSGIGLPGGFVGVDIFFVISGYVITSSITRQIHRDRSFNLRAFYLNRVVRLLPGLLLVLLPSLLFSFLFFDPYLEYPEIALAAMSGLLFSANLYFATINSYDDLVENPLRHLWSLGVEEHFYVLFPLLFYFVYSRGKGDCERKLLRVKQVLIFISLASLALSLIAHYLAPSIIELLGYPNLRQYAFERGRQLSFFFSPFRAWEILLGCLVAVNRFNAGTKGHWASSLLPTLGALAIFISPIAFTEADQFPGLRAAIPVLGTAILITFSPRSKLERLLSIPPLVYLGNISYSLYLWHWPIMVLIQRLVESPWINALISIPLSCSLAALSTSYFENRFRSREWRLRSLWPVLFVIPVCLGIAEFLRQSESFQQVIPRTESKTHTFAHSQDCDASPVGWEKSCIFGDRDANTSIYLFGDSNARSASDGLALTAVNNGWSLTIGALSACPVNFSQVQTSARCAIVNQQRLTLLQSKPPSVVVIVNHWTSYTNVPIYGTVEQQVASLRTTLQVLDALAIPVIIQYQIPICEFQNRLVSVRLFEGRIVSGSKCLAKSRDDEMRLAVGEQVSKLAQDCESAPCEVVDLSPLLCDANCHPFRDGVNIFADASHISPSASRLTASLYRDKIRNLLSAKQHLS